MTSRETAFCIACQWCRLLIISLPRESRVMWLRIVVLTISMSLCHSGSCAEEKSKASDNVSLNDGSWKDLEKYVGTQKGRIVVVDLWSTSCLPCMKEFPGLVKLSNDHPKDVSCVSFNLDYVGIKSKPPEYYRERVTKFLTARKATLKNFLSTDEADKVFADIKLSSIPAVFVYDREGELVKRFDSSLIKDGESEAFTYQNDIKPFVRELLSSE